MTVWNVFVITFLIFPGNYLIGLPSYNRFASTIEPNNCKSLTDTSDVCQRYMDGQNKLKHFTYIFNVFVFMQIFNEINCRKIGIQDFNVFDKFFHNFYFLAIVIGTVALQILFNYYFPSLINVVRLSKSEWGGCIVMGASPLLISIILKLTPTRWVELVPTTKYMDENEVPEDNKVLSTWNKINAGQNQS